MIPSSAIDDFVERVDPTQRGARARSDAPARAANASSTTRARDAARWRAGTPT